MGPRQSMVVVVEARRVVRGALAALALLAPLGPAQASVGGWTPSLEGNRAGTIRALAVDPKSPRTVYAGDNNGRVFKSTDGGASWKTASTGLPSPSPQAPFSVLTLAIDPQRPQTLYAGGEGNRIFKSTDGGASWKVASTGLPSLLSRVNAIVIDPQRPQTLYAGVFFGGTEMGVFKSTNGGARWRAAGLPGERADALAIASTTRSLPRQTLYAAAFEVSKSTDGGASWNPASNGLSSEGNEGLSTLAIDPDQPQTLYAGGPSHVFKSTDGGASWRAASRGLPRDVWIRALAIDPKTPQTLYAGDIRAYGGQGAGVFKSTNGGASWRAASSGLLRGATRQVYALAIDRKGQTLYAGTEFGVFKLALRPSG